MKSQRRHELHYNELGQSLANLLEWAKKYSNYLAWGALLAAVVVLVAVLVNRSRNKTLMERQNDYDRAITASDPEVRLTSLAKIADEPGDEFITIQATERVADEYANRIISGQGKASPDKLKEFAYQAKQYYQRLIDKAKEYPAMAAEGHFGLAKLAENDGNFEGADAEYREARKVSPPNYPILAFADEAIKKLALLRQNVNFATTAPATQPASAPAATRPATAPAGKTPATGATAPSPATKPAK